MKREKKQSKSSAERCKLLEIGHAWATGPASPRVILPTRNPVHDDDSSTSSRTKEQCESKDIEMKLAQTNVPNQQQRNLGSMALHASRIRTRHTQWGVDHGTIWDGHQKRPRRRRKIQRSCNRLGAASWLSEDPAAPAPGESVRRRSRGIGHQDAILVSLAASPSHSETRPGMRLRCQCRCQSLPAPLVTSLLESFEDPSMAVSLRRRA